MMHYIFLLKQNLLRVTVTTSYLFIIYPSGFMVYFYLSMAIAVRVKVDM